MKTIQIMCLMLLVTGLMTACGKQSGTSNLRVRMKDAPGDFQQVNVEIKAIEIHYTDVDKGFEGWVSLETKAGIYDLLLLQNNVTVILTDDVTIPVGEVDQLRLVLGSQNTVVIDNVSFPLKTPSAEQTGLKINLDTRFRNGKEYEVLLDFDAHQSIVLTGEGSFILKPVLKVEGIIEL